MGKLDQYCFDGTNALSLKKLPTDSKKDQVDKETILAIDYSKQTMYLLQNKTVPAGLRNTDRHGLTFLSNFLPMNDITNHTGKLRF